MTERSTHRRAKILFLILLAFLASLPEIGARLARHLEATEPGKPAYRQIAADYPLRDALIRDWRTLRFQYRDYYLYAPMPGHSETVNFTDYFGARHTPSSIADGTVDELVWAFGGSTMQNLEATDEFTLANQIVHELNRQGVRSRLFNFGVGAFQSTLESIRFQSLLRAVHAEERPTTALFYDGFNDALFAYYYGAGRPQADVSSKMADLIERAYLRLAVYSVSQWLSERSVFWARFVGPNVEQVLHGGAPPDGSEENLAAAVRSYVTNVESLRGICAAFGIRCMFVLQPLLATREPLTPFEQDVLAKLEEGQVRFTRAFYAHVKDRLMGAPDFHDLSHFYDGHEAPVFFDFGHTSPVAGIPLGRELAHRLIKARESRSLP